MTHASSRPSLLRLRLLSLRPHLTLTEIQLVDTTLLYRRLDGRDHVPTEVRAVRPPAADWDALQVVLDEAFFWSWPSRWPRVHVGYEGEFAIAVAWGDRAAVSIGEIGVAPEVEAVLGAIGLLISTERAVATARRAGPDPHLPAEIPKRRRSRCNASGRAVAL